MGVEIYAASDGWWLRRCVQLDRLTPFPHDSMMHESLRTLSLGSQAF